MGRPIDVAFIKCGHHTRPDFWRLVDVAGFSTVRIDEVDLVQSIPRVYIVPWWDEQVAQAVARQQRDPAYANSPTWIVWWCVDGTIAQATDRARLLFDADTLFDAVWTSDVRLATPALPFVLIGGDGRLESDPPVEIQWDATLHVERGATGLDDIVDRFLHAGLRLAPFAGSNNINIVPHTRVMVNAVDDGESAIRAAIAASHHMALVSAPLGLPEPLVPGVDFLEHEDVAELTRRLLTGDAGLPSISLLSENLYELLVEEHPFGDNIREAVADLVLQGVN